MLTKTVKIVLIVLLAGLKIGAGFSYAGPFGPPEPLTRGEKGIHTGFGYWFHEGKYGDSQERRWREQQIYSELGYGRAERWELYGRIGIAGLRIGDAFSSTHPATQTSKQDFQDRGGYFGALGGKVFFPARGNIGLGAFIQGAYYFRGFEDDLSGVLGGASFTTKIVLEKLWEVNLGLALQARFLAGAKLYLGPYYRYAERTVSPAANIAHASFAAGARTMANKAPLGGFLGLELPLARGFRLNLEGQYAEGLSLGTIVTYLY